MPTTSATVAAAQLLLRELGLTHDQLDWTPVDTPTIADYLPRVVDAAGPGAQRTYGSYWDRILAAHGNCHLDEIHTSDITTLMRTCVAARRQRRTDRGGSSTGEHMLRAFRAIYTLAVADDLLPPHLNPAAQVRKPRRPPSQRRGLSTAELSAINLAACCGGNDARLDTLLLRLHTETAARRCGALRLRVEDIDTRWCLLRLREKGDSTRWQPASPLLIDALLRHIDERGERSADSPVLRFHDGTPLTTRRYDQLWHRLGEQLPWVAAQNITTHWLRHTTITWVERHFGFGIARAYAGHADTSGASTTTYIRGQLGEVATALAALTGLPHPLASPLRHSDTPDHDANPSVSTSAVVSATGRPASPNPGREAAHTTRNEPTPDRAVELFTLPDSPGRAPASSMSLTLLPTQRCKDRVDVLSVAAVSRSGRFSVRRHVAALGWEPGSALDFEVLPVAVLIRQTSRGRHRIDDRGQLFLPSGPRALLGLSAGDRVVVMTVPDHEVLLVQPLNAVLSQLTQQCSLLSSPQPADTYDVDIEVMAYQDTAGPDVDGDPHAVAGR